MQETWVWSLDQEDPLKKWQPTLVFLPEKSHGQRRLVDPSPWSCRRVRHHWATKQQQPWCHPAWDFRRSLCFGWGKQSCVQNLTRSLKLPALLILDAVLCTMQVASSRTEVFSSDTACESNITLLFSSPKHWGLLFYSLALRLGSWGSKTYSGQEAARWQWLQKTLYTTNTGSGVG